MKILTIEVGFIPTNCYLLCDTAAGGSGGVAAVIDPGFESARILAELGKTGCRAEYVILTHGHFDHRTEAKQILDATGAKLVACVNERKMLLDAGLSLHDQYSGYIKTSFVPLKADIEVDDDSVLTLGSLKLGFITTPGHTEGGCCVRCENVIFTGDTLFCGDVGRTDVPTASRTDIIRSARRLAALDGDFVLYPGHGCATSLDEERRHNPYLRGAGL